MENTPGQNKDCGCNDNCCPPKRKPKWIAFLSIGVLLVAIAIAAVKVIHNNSTPAAARVLNKSTKASGCDTTGKKGCDTTKSSSCCSKSGH